jgi:hypothetical protein
MAVTINVKSYSGAATPGDSNIRISEPAAGRGRSDRALFRPPSPRRLTAVRMHTEPGGLRLSFLADVIGTAAPTTYTRTAPGTVTATPGAVMVTPYAMPGGDITVRFYKEPPDGQAYGMPTRSLRPSNEDAGRRRSPRRPLSSLPLGGNDWQLLQTVNLN